MKRGAIQVEVLIILSAGIGIGYFLGWLFSSPPPAPTASQQIRIIWTGDFLPPLPAAVTSPVQMNFKVTRAEQHWSVIEANTPVYGAKITFTLAQGNAAVTPATAFTDTSGLAPFTLSPLRKGTDALTATFTTPGANPITGSESFSFEVNP